MKALITTGLALAFFTIAFFLLSAGTLIWKLKLKGSCSGKNHIYGPDGKKIRCETCPNR